ncbi:MAG: hypothetical protein ABII19_04210 [Patescibacteria group bacterium]
MAKMVKKNKKTVSKKRSTKKREVEIPVFVISKKERAVATKAEEKKELGIFKDRDDLPVFQNFFPADQEEEKQEEVKKEWKHFKNAAHKKEAEVLISKKENQKRGPLLPESRKRIIMWASVAILACLIFFIWFSGLKNNFSGLLGSVSYTFSRSEGVFEEAGDSLEELNNEAVAPEETAGENSETVDGEEILDQIKEKILVEELKSKL